MKNIVKSIVIRSTAENIFEMLAADRLPKWQPYYARTQKFEYVTNIQTHEDKYAVGAIATFDVDCHYEIVSCDKNKLMRYKIYENTFLGYFEGYVKFRLSPVEEGIEFSYSIVFLKPSGFYGRLLFNYFTRRWFTNRIIIELGKIKSILEDSN